MTRPPTRLLVAVALPPLALGALGLTHPENLTDSTAQYWRDIHIVLLPLFPLLALAPWLIVRGESRGLGWLAAALGVVYALFYSALDVLAGIGAGALQLDGAASSTGILFREGNGLADYGVYAYLAATVLAAVVALRRAGLAALLGAVLVVPGAIVFLGSHIYWPDGVLTMLALAVGWTALAVAVTRERDLT